MLWRYESLLSSLKLEESSLKLEVVTLWKLTKFTQTGRNTATLSHIKCHTNEVHIITIIFISRQSALPQLSAVGASLCPSPSRLFPSITQRGRCNPSSSLSSISWRREPPAGAMGWTWHAWPPSQSPSSGPPRSSPRSWKHSSMPGGTWAGWLDSSRMLYQLCLKSVFFSPTLIFPTWKMNAVLSYTNIQLLLGINSNLKRKTRCWCCTSVR